MPRELKLKVPLIWDGKQIETLSFADPKFKLMDTLHRAQQGVDANQVSATMAGIASLVGLPTEAIAELALEDGIAASDLFGEMTSGVGPFE